MSSVSSLFSKLIHRLSPQRSPGARSRRERTTSPGPSSPSLSVRQHCQCRWQWGVTCVCTTPSSGPEWPDIDMDDTESACTPCRAESPLADSGVVNDLSDNADAQDNLTRDANGNSETADSSTDQTNPKPCCSHQNGVKHEKGSGAISEEPDSVHECAICLLPCIHPVKLPCTHVFCYLCMKGVANQSKRCALCRQEIPLDFLSHPALLRLEDLQKDSLREGTLWFYEGKNGWWQYDERTSSELEEKFEEGVRVFELLIAGFLYVIDLKSMIQIRRNDPTRRRRIKRDTADIPDKKGVAGLKIAGVVGTPERRECDGGETALKGASATGVQATPSQSAPDQTDSSGTQVPSNTPQTPEEPAPGMAGGAGGVGEEGSPAESTDDLNSHMLSLRLGNARHQIPRPRPRRHRRHRHRRNGHHLLDSPQTSTSDSDYDY